MNSTNLLRTDKFNLNNHLLDQKTLAEIFGADFFNKKSESVDNYFLFSRVFS